MGDWPTAPGALDEDDEEALGAGGGREEEVVEGGAARDGSVGVLEDEDRDCAAGDAEVARLPDPPGYTVRVVMVSAGGHRWAMGEKRSNDPRG